jgi:hypothetical protein
LWNADGAQCQFFLIPVSEQQFARLKPDWWWHLDVAGEPATLSEAGKDLFCNKGVPEKSRRCIL